MKYFILCTLFTLLGAGGTLLIQKHIIFLQSIASQFTGVVLVGGTRAGMSMSDHAAYVYAAMGGLLVLVALKTKSEIQRRWVNYQSKKIITAAFEQKEGKPKLAVVDKAA